MKKPNSIRLRYARMKRNTTHIYNKGAVKHHPGFKDEWKKRTILAVTFDSSTKESIFHLSSDLVDNMGIESLVGDRDFPLHTTVVEAKLNEEVKPKRFPTTFWSLKSVLDGALAGVEISFNHLIHDGCGTIFLASDMIPDVIVNGRKLASKLFEESGFDPSRLDILHCAALRITDPGASGAKLSTMIAIQDRVNDIDRKLRRNPVVARIEGIVLAQTYQFLAEGPTSVPRPPKS